MSVPAYPSYRDSAVEWLGEVPSHWLVMPLKYVASFAGGGTPSREVPAYWNGDTPWVSPKDMKAEIIQDSEDRITDAGLAAGAASLIEPYAVLMVVRSGILRHTIPVAINHTPVALNQDMKAIRLDAQQCHPRFLLRLVQGMNTTFLNLWLKQGATVESIEHEYLASTPIPLPTSEEQSAIVAFLDRETAKIDALVEAQRRLIELLKEKRQAVISHAVTKGLDPSAPMKDSGIEWLGQVPAHWRVGKLGHAAKLRGGFAFSSANFGSEGTAVVRMNNLKRGHLDLSDAARIPEAACNPNVALSDGDLVWGMSGSIGETGSLGNYARVQKDDLPLQLNQRVGRFELTPTLLLTEFLEQVLQAAYFTEQIVLLVTGTAQFNVSSEQVESSIVALPPLDEQREIVGRIRHAAGKFENLTSQAEMVVALLNERRAALISAAVTGKIDVRNAVPEAEAA